MSSRLMAIQFITVIVGRYNRMKHNSERDSHTRTRGEERGGGGGGEGCVVPSLVSIRTETAVDRLLGHLGFLKDDITASVLESDMKLAWSAAVVTPSDVSELWRMNGIDIKPCPETNISFMHHVATMLCSIGLFIELFVDSDSGVYKCRIKCVS
jgi:hypothetical protein